MKEKLIDMKWAVWRAWKYDVNPRAAWRKLVKFWQRGRRRIAVEDTWGLDDYLTDIIVQGVHRLRQDSHGYPASLLGDDFTGSMVLDEDDKANVAKWDDILEKIVRGFVARKMLGDLDHWSRPLGAQRGDYSRFEPNLELEVRLEQARDEGMALFVKYYDGLWD